MKKTRSFAKFILPSLFLTIFIINASAQKITLSFHNETFEKVLNSIKQQTGLSLVFSEQLVDLNRKINIDVNSIQLEDALNKLLVGTNLSFEIKNKKLYFIEKNELKNTPVKSKKVNGLVTDEKGDPIIGASVVLRGSNTGTITNINGEFFLEVSEQSEIIVSYIGFKQTNLKVGKADNYRIKLEEDSKTLDEVVVVGYGTSQKKDLTGAVGVVRSELIENRQSVQLSQALQGAMAGVTVTRSSGAPGSTSTIRVRGVTTIGNSDALIVVDGVPSETIDNVNSNDIESISVLKDAASASIYGSRAAAGVILVTTKRAKEGQARFTYNYETGMEKPTELPEYVDVVRYMQLVNERQLNDGSAEMYSEMFINDYLANHHLDSDSYPATNWQESVYKSFAPRTKHEMSLIMGTEKVKTKASFNYTNIDGLYSNSSYNRYMFRLNNDVNINKMLSANIDVAYKRSNNMAPAPSQVSGRTVSYLARVLPGIYDDKYDDGRYAPGKDGLNILAEVNEGGSALSWYNQLTGRFVLDFKPLKNLSIKALLAPTLDFNQFKTFAKTIEYTDKADPQRIIATNNRARTSLSEERSGGTTFNGQFLVNYSNKFLNHNNFNILLGYEENQLYYETLSASREGFMVNLPYLNLGSEDFRDNAGSAYEVATQSFFGRIDYNYQQKYFVQLNARYDGSSRFHPDHRWAFFPSVSGGWIVTEEDFMKNIDLLSYFKLRASYGQVGNERIGNYPYQSSIDYNNALFYQDGIISSIKTGAQTTYSVEDITWEKTQSYDIGFDAALFSQKLSISGDYYKKSTTDILLELDIPIYLGYVKPYQNAGAMSAKGWELELSWKDNIGGLKYGISFNISDVKTRIDDLKGTQLKGDQAKFEGGEFNEWYGYQSNGIYQTQDQVDKSSTTSTNVGIGDIWYEDISGKDGVPDGEINDYDKTLLGGSLPRYTYGANLNFGYKGFDLSLSFNGVGKIKSLLTNVQVRPFQEGGIGNVPKIIDGQFWSSYNTDVQNLQARYPRLSTTGASNNYAMSDFWLIDGSYFRIKNITFGYTIPFSENIKKYIKNLKVYVAANDLLSLDKYPKGWDPESTATGYPIVTTLMAGLNITF
ncbi:MAG: TonB-dependent receptor [Paludibacter sp.]|nr:TonB-dependent receptor [Paludibacter sp.]